MGAAALSAGLGLLVGLAALLAGDGPSPAALSAHADTLRARLDPAEFHVVIAAPFVVVGDGPAAEVERHAERTVRWAVRRLREAFFERGPAEVIEIWLFGDAASYQRNTRLRFGHRPHTPFGFYSPEHRALVMDISTGGGTLVHEIVHPFVRADFPTCPAWLNEGLGSLFEQCGEDGEGRIVGRTNWRLEDLQRAIRAGQLPPFAALLATSQEAFYGQDPGTNYAQARYLCYYLQEQGLLRRFYREFRAGYAVDPTGLETLKRVLGTDDLGRFQREWSEFVLGLRFP